MRGAVLLYPATRWSPEEYTDVWVCDLCRNATTDPDTFGDRDDCCLTCQPRADEHDPPTPTHAVDAAFTDHVPAFLDGVA